MELEANSSRTVWTHEDDITSFRIINQSLCKNIYQLNVWFIECGESRTRRTLVTYSDS